MYSNWFLKNHRDFGLMLPPLCLVSTMVRGENSKFRCRGFDRPWPRPKPDTIIFFSVCYKNVCAPKKRWGTWKKTILIVFKKWVVARVCLRMCYFSRSVLFVNVAKTEIMANRFFCKNDKTSILFKEFVYFNTYAFQLFTKCTFFCKIVESSWLFI